MRVDEFPAVLKDKDAVIYTLIGGIKLAKSTLLTYTQNPAILTIDGMESGEVLLGMDFRPATGQLYCVGNTSRIYIINTETGKATALGSAPFSPVLSGTLAGFDFNPMADRIRIVTSTGQNLRLHPETGAMAGVDGAINGGTSPVITAAAYSGNIAKSFSTTLFDIDITSDKLYRQSPPNNGTLVEIGALGVDLSGNGGFDIAPDSTIALAAYGDKFYHINLETGAATDLGSLGGLTDITGIAIKTDVVAYVGNGGPDILTFGLLTGNIRSLVVSGVPAGESFLDIDFRPATGQLYGLTTGSRLMTVDIGTGVATQVGSGPFSTLLSGSPASIDFNPVVDRLRIVTNTGQNLRVNPENGAVIVDGPVTTPGVSVTGIAYTNNFAGATSTALYDIDALGSRLYLQNPPNDGGLSLVGPLGITLLNLSRMGGFDIGSTSGTAYAMLNVTAGTRIYSINLSTGAATQVGFFVAPATGFTVGLGF